MRRQVVLGAGTIALIFVGLLVAPMPLWAGGPAGPLLAGALPAEPVGWVGMLVAGVFALALCLPYRPYSLVLRTLSVGAVSNRLLLLLTGLLAGVGLLMYPRFGSDIFDYAGFERMWVVYGDNPLVALVANRPTDWAAVFVWYPDQTPGYGPLWALLTWPIVRLSGDSAFTEVVGYKLLAGVAYGMCCWLIWSSVAAVRRQRALVLFAWSPLVLFEVLGKVHNDILPALSVLGMVWLACRGKSVASMLAVVAGALTKPTVLVAALVLAVELWRLGSWRRLLLTASAGLLMVGLAYAPFWVGLHTLSAVLQQAARPGWSVATLLSIGVASVTGQRFQLEVRLVLGLLWVGVCAMALTRRQRHQPLDLAAASGWLIVATVLLLASAVFAHYFVPAVALAAVAADSLLERVVMWLSIGGLAAYAIELLSLTFGPAWIGSTAFELVGSLVLFGPAATAMLLCRPREGSLRDG